MKTMYKAWFRSINKVEILRETDKSVFVKDFFMKKGRRDYKTSTHYAYRDTFEEAKQFIVQNAEADYKRFKAMFDDAAKRLEQANNLTEAQCK